MIGLDTNVLARYYVEDAGDAEAMRQRMAARRLIESGVALAVCKTVLLELEWVMRGYYRLPPSQVAKAMRHVLALPQVEVEDRETIAAALGHYEMGLDFADALHHASYRDCRSMATFDNRKFARRASRMGLSPSVSVIK